MLQKVRGLIVRLVCLAFLSAGFTQYSHAGMVGTGYMIDSEARQASLARVEVALARDDVATQLAAFGVDQALVAERLQGLSDLELLALQGEIDEQLAGGDALAVIGIVFLVLMILELTGVTDIFKSF
ncbi:MAG: PA2779 family protein [Pseudomonadota bacterium]